MGTQSNAAPVIIKRKKVVGGDGHHGGAWKVAYADFVTAMMAFFMLMWLLNATTEKQRKGIADYFSPTIPINRISGGGDGPHGGDSIFSEQTLARHGTGASSMHPMVSNAAKGSTGGDADAKETGAGDEALKQVEEMLLGRGGESDVADENLKHIVTRVTDEGLVIELFALRGVPLFELDSTTPTPLLEGLAQMLVPTMAMVSNSIAIEGHMRSQPIVIADNPVWEVSAKRANVVRALLEQNGMHPQRVQRVTGHADREPSSENPMSERNDRIEIVLIRDLPR